MKASTELFDFLSKILSVLKCNRTEEVTNIKADFTTLNASIKCILTGNRNSICFGKNCFVSRN